MKTEHGKLFLAVSISLLIIMFCISPDFRYIYSLPTHMRIIEGESRFLNVQFPMTVSCSTSLNEAIRLQPARDLYAFSRDITINTEKIGKSEVEFSIMGIIPIKKVEIDVLPAIKVLPGGHSIGVVLKSAGVVVIGFSPIRTQGDELIIPAKDAGIHVGDTLISINDIAVESDSQVADIIDQSGKEQRSLNIGLKREKENISITMNPILCTETNRYRIGLFVRDSAAGVGTLTFYEPDSKVYGALGHIIVDNDTKQPIDCHDGKIVLASVSGIQQGKRGQPGEKVGLFIEGEKPMGNIKKNTSFGIYGQITNPPENKLYNSLIPVASMSQVQEGSAEILTVIEGEKIESFQIEIQKINLQDEPEAKGMVIKVTDPRLLAKTGGIVQGMSGSPILQNGKMIGAVTHVFVNDPTKGYGCFIDWMLMESGIIQKKKYHLTRNLFAVSGHSLY